MKKSSGFASGTLRSGDVRRGMISNKFVKYRG